MLTSFCLSLSLSASSDAACDRRSDPARSTRLSTEMVTGAISGGEPNHFSSRSEGTSAWERFEKILALGQGLDTRTMLHAADSTILYLYNKPGVVITRHRHRPQTACRVLSGPMTAHGVLLWPAPHTRTRSPSDPRTCCCRLVCTRRTALDDDPDHLV